VGSGKDARLRVLSRRARAGAGRSEEVGMLIVGVSRVAGQVWRWPSGAQPLRLVAVAGCTRPPARGRTGGGQGAGRVRRVRTGAGDGCGGVQPDRGCACGQASGTDVADSGAHARGHTRRQALRRAASEQADEGPRKPRDEQERARSTRRERERTGALRPAWLTSGHAASHAPPRSPRRARGDRGWVVRVETVSPAVSSTSILQVERPRRKPYAAPTSAPVVRSGRGALRSARMPRRSLERGATP
jgi:hypothetical protein